MADVALKILAPVIDYVTFVTPLGLKKLTSNAESDCIMGALVANVI